MAEPNDDPRTRILMAAGPVFADKGFDGSTVREISTAAGVNLAAVNYYFGDKERLYLETVKHAREIRSQQEPLPEWDDSVAARDKLRGFVHTMLRRMVGLQAAPWQVRLMMREIVQPSQACRELVGDHFRPTFELLLDIIVEVVGKSLPRHHLEQLGFSIFGQCLYYRVAGEVVAMMVDPSELETHYSTDLLADHIVNFSLAALSNLRSGEASHETALNIQGT
jgi:AcrR family transcriptional regulator